MKLVSDAWKLSPAARLTRRRAIIGILATWITAFGADEAVARAIHGGIAVAGGGYETTLTPWTITNNTASPMTNVPIEVPIVFSAAGGAAPFLSTDAIKVYDSDGTTVIPVQECNRFSDLAGPDIRGSKLVCILPNLGASQARQLTIKKVATTSPTTGTEITAAEIVATGFSLAAVMDHGNGTTYTADVATGLSASTWTNKTTASNKGRWLQDGGLATSYIVTCPFKNGGTAAPDNITLWAEVTAYKAQRGAVSGGNPIIAIRCQYWLQNAFAQGDTSTIINHWFDLSVTCGTNTQNWVGSSPAKTLTLSTTGNVTNATATVPAGGTTFTADSVGQVISDGLGGSARIITYNSATSVTVRMANAMSATSYTSGNWRIFGMNMAYATDVPPQEIWYGGSPAITAKPDILSHLGVAWSGTAGGPISYFSSTKMILPFSTPYSDVTNSVSRLDLCGTNPTGVANNGYIGDWIAYMPTTGGFEDRAPIPGFFVGGLTKFDTNGQRVIMENARKYALFPMWFIDENTGKAPTFNCGTNWFYGGDNWFGTRLPLGTNYATSNRVQEATVGYPQLAHRPVPEYVPALLTGDFYWVERLHKTLFFIWSINNQAALQLNRLGCNYSELRGNGWSHLTLMQAILLTPDRDPAVLSYTRSHMTTWMDNHYTYTGSGTPGVNPEPGINLGLVANTGSGKVFATAGWRGMVQGGNYNEAQWQLGYVGAAFFLARGFGMVSGDRLTFMNWFMEGLTGAATNAAVVPNWLAPSYYASCVTNAQVAAPAWADVYKNTCADITETGMNKRVVTGTGINLSGLSGSGITVTMPSGYFGGGSSFYNDGFVIDGNAASFQVAPFSRNSGLRDPSITSFKNEAVGTTSSSYALPTNNGSIRLWNTGSLTYYYKLTVGAGTATTGDTAIASGASIAINVGANTYINVITASGVSEFKAYGSVGANYAVNDDITVAVANASSNFSITTHAVLRVAAVGPNGDINSMTIQTPGLYIANSLYTQGSTDSTVTQTSTTGSGTGFTFFVWSPDTSGFNGNSRCPIKFGTAIITGVSGDVLTLDTSGYCQRAHQLQYCYPFAQTGLVTNKILVPGPAVGDSAGNALSIAGPALPQPYTATNEYWAIAKNCAKLADLWGVTDGAAANTNLAPMYTGFQEQKWRVVN